LSAVMNVSALRRHLEESAPIRLVDVRSGSEYGTGHIPGAINIPLEQIEARTEDFGKGEVVLICKSGKRARMAAVLLEPCRAGVAVLEGGTDAWIEAGFPVVASLTTRWSLERQVRLAAGLIVVVGVALSVLVSSWWVYLAGFIGLGLTFAGLTDFCPMGVLLAKMPWNGPRACAGASTNRDDTKCCCP
jgi:rhodanese-related sulfurtransferase